MVFAYKDKDMTKHYRQDKGHSVKQMLNELPHKNYKKEGLIKLLNKIGSTGSVDIASSSEGRKSATADENVNVVENLIFVKRVNHEHNKQKKHCRFSWYFTVCSILI